MTTTMRSGPKRSALLGVALALVLAATAGACAPTPPPTGLGISCEPVTTRVAATPGITFETQPVELRSTGPSSASPCSDRTGLGITSVRFKDFSVKFPATNCLPEPGTAGSGTGTAIWSDGTTSYVGVDAAYTDTFSGTLHVTVLDGTFSQFEGTGQFWASPTAGSCYDGGVTRADINVSIPQLLPPSNG